MTYHIHYYSDQVYRLDGILTPDECQHHIQSSEDLHYHEATINTGTEHILAKDIRDNDRVIIDSTDIAEKLWHRVKNYLPHIPEWSLYSLNERLRFYRYQNGQRFRWHRDGSYVRNDHEASLITLILYLNEDFSGGDTSFRFYDVKPKMGSALIFPHQIMHQGSAVTEGCKYVLRTDVMYQHNTKSE
ncbi:MAG: iron-regulated protein [Methylococcales bacterium]|jgi:predicted 2-oxoglutarate/Fe(II)-dependent dioxygenase YbiX|nr:iron-regulated protein [Methylococcales bacterium]MBT7442500.1 iron-regulated protein [Methylococcales bacterium]